MKITNITLYGGLDETVADTVAAKAYLDSLNIEYTNLFYSDPTQFKHVIGPVNSWFDNVEIKKFPFVVWDEESTQGVVVRKVATSLKEMKAANLKQTKGSDK